MALFYRGSSIYIISSIYTRHCISVKFSKETPSFVAREGATGRRTGMLLLRFDPESL